jgi:hypothetical protein
MQLVGLLAVRFRIAVSAAVAVGVVLGTWRLVSEFTLAFARCVTLEHTSGHGVHDARLCGMLCCQQW